jgi:hypothetical protein
MGDWFAGRWPAIGRPMLLRPQGWRVHCEHEPGCHEACRAFFLAKGVVFPPCPSRFSLFLVQFSAHGSILSLSWRWRNGRVY